MVMNSSSAEPASDSVANDNAGSAFVADADAELAAVPTPHLYFDQVSIAASC